VICPKNGGIVLDSAKYKYLFSRDHLISNSKLFILGYNTYDLANIQVISSFNKIIDYLKKQTERILI